MSCMPTFKRHRFPSDIILCAVRWYLRYRLPYQDVVDLMAKRGIAVDRSTLYRWAIKFGPEITKRKEKYLRRASVDWHVPSRPIALQSPAGQGMRPISGLVENSVTFGALWMRTAHSRDISTQLPARQRIIDFRLTIAGSRYAVSMRGARRDAKAATSAIGDRASLARSGSSQDCFLRPPDPGLIWHSFGAKDSMQQSPCEPFLVP